MQLKVAAEVDADELLQLVSASCGPVFTVSEYVVDVPLPPLAGDTLSVPL